MVAKIAPRQIAATMSCHKGSPVFSATSGLLYLLQVRIPIA
jgi:hypothetical protein